MATPRMFDNASSKSEILKILSENGVLEMKSDSNTGQITAIFNGTRDEVVDVLKQGGASVKVESTDNQKSAHGDLRKVRNIVTIEKSNFESVLTHLEEFVKREEQAWRSLREEVDLRF